MSADTAASPTLRGIAIRLEGIAKRFGAVTAVDRCTLDIPPGAFVTILGPSGSGKTTLLNLIAGFLNPDAGEIFFGGTPVSKVPSHKRGIGMVFQNFALFPHMSVFDNVAFPIRMRERATDSAVARRVAETLEIVRLAGLAERRPSQLSAGQRQRVAMARALISRPPLLLLDEPLSALDKSLREELQVEIKTLHRKVGSTFICVTHDQQEALAMSDIVVVMREGRIEQTAEPEALYRRPGTAFVARFLGGANILPGRMSASGESGTVDMGGGERLFARSAENAMPGSQVQVVFRPETVRLEQLNGQQVSDVEVNRLKARVTEAVFLGEAMKMVLERNGRPILVKLTAVAARKIHLGEEVVLAWPAEETLLMAADQEEG